jgi:SAM-dependent methyltransferase
VAELYARVRPGYLPEVFDDLVALSGLPDGGRILEIGPATGQATVPLAQRGFRISAIEPDAPLVAVARQRIDASAEVEFHVSRFEDWPLPDQPFDLVLAATAFHWLDPSVRYVKAAAALRPGGAVAIVNTHHVAGGSQAFFDDVQSCYEAHMPNTLPGVRLPAADDLIPDTTDLLACGLFDAPVIRRYAWQAAYTAGEYIELLSTYSDHIALAPASRQALFDCIASLIETRFQGRIAKGYLTELIVARKRSDAER